MAINAIFIEFDSDVNKISTMFYFAKSLQAAAMAVVALALFVGFREDSMSKELTMLAIGSALFLISRWLEPSSRKA